MGTILAAIDNTGTARAVLAAARSFAGLVRGELEAVHVREGDASRAHAEARAAGVPLRELRDPVPGGIVHEAERGEVQALALGICGGPVARRPAGHVALEVMTAVAKPLLAVPPELATPFLLRRALVPLDGTAPTADALAETIELACDSDLEVVVLHVFGPDTPPLFSDQPQHEVDAWTREFLARFVAYDGHVRLVSRIGRPGESVLEVAREVEADLIALGWSRALSPGRAEVVREALRSSHVPVLLTPVTGAAARPEPALAERLVLRSSAGLGLRRGAS